MINLESNNFIFRYVRCFYNAFIYSDVREQFIIAFIAVIGAIMAIPSLFLFFYLKSYTLGFLALFVMSSELICAYFRRFFVTSSLVLLTVVNIAALIYGVETGSLGNAHAICFSTFFVSFVVYFRKYRFVFFINSFHLICIVLFLEFHTTSYGPRTLFSEGQLQLIGTITFIGYSAALGSTVYFYYKSQQLPGTIKVDSLIEIFKLTHRESEVVSLVVDGKTNREISESLYISVPTVKTYLNQIYKKFDVSNRSSVVSFVLQTMHKKY